MQHDQADRPAGRRSPVIRGPKKPARSLQQSLERELKSRGSLLTPKGATHSSGVSSCGTRDNQGVMTDRMGNDYYS